MGFRKFKADLLFTGTQILPSTAILIVKDDGTVDGIVDERAAGDDIRICHGMLTPGFVNTHCHLELSHMKGRIPPGTGLVPFLTRVITERGQGAEQVYQAMEAAIEEMYSTGTVAVGDICNLAVSLAVKSKSRLRWRNFIEVMGFTEDKAQYRFTEAEKVVREFREYDKTFPESGREHRFNGASLTPHAPYSVSRRLFELVNEASTGKILTIHNQESQPENRLYEQREGEMFDLYSNLGIDSSAFVASGKTSLQTYLPWLDKPSHIILVHNTYSSEEDILFALSHFHGLIDLFFCLCVNANRYIESSLPPVDLLRKHGATITVGTDSYASNWQLNMLEEIKSIQQAFGPAVPLAEILQWATLNGAMALQMEDALGSFEPGKKPGIVLIDKVDNGMIARDAKAAVVSL